MKRIVILTFTVLCALPYAAADDAKIHLFVLSGQSNMAGMDPNLTFVPTVEKAFGKSNVVVVKDAKGGEPIHRWYKKWEQPGKKTPAVRGALYDRLIKKVKDATRGKEIESATFVWMQGERDAKEKAAAVYAASLQGVIDQLSGDLSHDKLNVVIGRLSDFDMANKRYPHWTRIREAQVELAESNSRYRWVDTDDLNDGKNRAGRPIKNDLHYSVEGYKTLGQRFAEQAIELVRKSQQ